MQDILLQKNNDNIYDFVIENGSFSGVDGLESAILVSLFTDARASSAAVSDPIMRRGWVGNILNQNLERELGSVLWLSDMARVDQTTVNFFKAEVKNAFNWMLQDGIVNNFIVTPEITGVDSLKVSINFINNDGETERYVILWRSTDQI